MMAVREIIRPGRLMVSWIYLFLAHHWSCVTSRAIILATSCCSWNCRHSACLSLYSFRWSTRCGQIGRTLIRPISGRFLVARCKRWIIVLYMMNILMVCRLIYRWVAPPSWIWTRVDFYTSISTTTAHSHSSVSYCFVSKIRHADSLFSPRRYDSIGWIVWREHDI